MAPIPTFGFSAFLRLICLNEKPQKTAIRNRHSQNKSGGYDFHKSLRNNVRKLATGTSSIEEVLDSVSAILQKAERESAEAGIKRFIEWMNANPGEVSFCDPLTFTSPASLFRITFQADFVIDINGRKTAVHIWNTKLKLSKNIVMAALTLVAANWKIAPDSPNDFAVLSLRDGEMYRWSDDQHGHLKAGNALMLHLDRVCTLVRKDFNLPTIGDSVPPPRPPAD